MTIRLHYVQSSIKEEKRYERQQAIAERRNKGNSQT